MRWNLGGWLLATALASTACHSMTPLSWRDLDGLRPSRVWVTQADQTTVEVSGPQVFGDTLVGYVNGEFKELPTADVQRVTIRQPARAKTIALIAASTAVAAGLAVWISNSGLFGDTSFIDCPDVPDDPRCL